MAPRGDIIERLPRAAVVIVWTLAALHWRTGGHFAGITQRGLMYLTGTGHRVSMLRAIRLVVADGTLVRSREMGRKGHFHNVIRLTHTTLKELEARYGIVDAN